MNYSVIIVAAGKGSRMGLPYNKVYHVLNNSKTVLENSMEPFLLDDDCQQIIVVCDIDEFLGNISIRYPKLVLARGGKERMHSVYQGLKAVTSQHVLIHDGARPYVTKAIIERIKNGLTHFDACICGVFVKDTIKVVIDEKVKETLDRNTLMHIQTPQGFHTQKLLMCYRKALHEGFLGSDDSVLFEKFENEPVKVVSGDYRNIKITTIEDIL